MEKSKQHWLEIGCPLSMEHDLIAIKTDIKNGVLPKKHIRVLYVAAYNEMRRHQGKKEDRRMDCASCGNELARQMKIWLVRYESRTKEQQAKANVFIMSMLSEGKHKPKLLKLGKRPAVKLPELEPSAMLETIDNRRTMYEEMEWNELRKLMTSLPQEAQGKLNAEKTRNYPKKSAIIEELLKVKP